MPEKVTAALDESPGTTCPGYSVYVAGHRIDRRFATLEQAQEFKVAIQEALFPGF